MAYEAISVEQQNGVLTITFNREERRNAFNANMSSELNEAVENVKGSTDVRVVVLTGRGRSFMSGADVSMLQGWFELEASDLNQELDEIFNPRDLTGLSQPVVGALNGHTFGMGLEIALACDLLVASSSAQLGFPEINIGLIPGAGGTQRLSRMVGVLRAHDIVMTGRVLTADEALSWGLVNRVVDPNQFEDAVAEIADGLLGRSPLALEHAKRSVRAADEHGLMDGEAIERTSFVRLIGSEDAREGAAAFMEKRRPDFKGR